MKETKGIILKAIVWTITIGSGLFIGENLLSGESLATIENIVAGGSIGISQALLLAMVLFKNVLPEKTAASINNNVIPVVQELEQKTNVRFDNLESKLQEVLTILLTDKELRDKLLNQEE